MSQKLFINTLYAYTFTNTHPHLVAKPSYVQFRIQSVPNRHREIPGFEP